MPRASTDTSLELRLGAVLSAAAGTLLVALSLTVLPWYDDSPGSSIVAGSFRDLHDVETLAELYGLPPPMVLRAYFDWLAAALFLAAIAAIGLTAGPAIVRGAGRILGPLAAATGIVATCWAVSDLWDRVGGRAGLAFAEDSRIGFWAALLGFALLGLAAGLGVRRRR